MNSEGLIYTGEVRVGAIDISKVDVIVLSVAVVMPIFVRIVVVCEFGMTVVCSSVADSDTVGSAVISTVVTSAIEQKENTCTTHITLCFTRCVPNYRKSGNFRVKK